MSNSLRDQLIKSGLVGRREAHAGEERKPAVKKAARRQGRNHSGPPAAQQEPSGKRRPHTGASIDLAQAYAMRARSEAREAREARARAEAEAKARREQNRRLTELVAPRALNRKDAAIARHFEYGGKIRRVYVTAEQLEAVNRGELGVVQLRGRYLLLPAALVREVATFAAPHVALLVDPAATTVADDGVPDDLIW